MKILNKEKVINKVGLATNKQLNKAMEQIEDLTAKTTQLEAEVKYGAIGVAAIGIFCMGYAITSKLSRSNETLPEVQPSNEDEETE